MRDHGPGDDPPVVIACPPEIDASNVMYAYDPLYAAVVSGVPAVIADFTATAFCDVAGVRGLLMLRDLAADRDMRFRLVIPPGALIRRVLELLEVEHLLPVYPSVEEAARLLVPSAQDPLPSYFPRSTRGCVP